MTIKSISAILCNMVVYLILPADFIGKIRTRSLLPSRLTRDSYAS
jgi:hypothetical protein